MGQISPPCLLNLGLQHWLEKFGKTTLRGGRGAGEGHFRLGCEVSQLNLTRIVSVTLHGTDLAILPSQSWFTRLAGKIRKTTMRAGRGAEEGRFRLACVASQLHIIRIVGLMFSYYMYIVVLRIRN